MKYLFIIACFCMIVPGLHGDITNHINRYGLEINPGYQGCDPQTLQKNECPYVEVSRVTCLNMTYKDGQCKHVNTVDNSHETSKNHPTKSWQSLKAYHDHPTGPRQRQFHGSCYDIEEGKCNLFKCVKKCCYGWIKDDNGQCLKRIPNDYCLNGGTFEWLMKRCVCQDGFSGVRCETPLCDPGCKNNGQCKVSETGEHVCSCLPFTRGKYCEEAICDMTCVYGKCVVDGMSTACLCDQGYYGITCEHSFDQDPSCQVPNFDVCINMYCVEECSTDIDCLPPDVCCTDGCCNTCMPPRISNICWHNGRSYRQGENYLKDNCTTCWCTGNGTWSCKTKHCDMFSNCIVKNDVRDDCCQYNGVTGFRQCPTIDCSDEVRTLVVESRRNYANMEKLALHAYDFSYKTLEVTYSPSRVYHCNCDNKPVTMIEASATDSNGATVTCQQAVIVKDDEPPVFLYCPSDYYTTYGESVRWKEPRASDNVGVYSFTSNFYSGHMFQQTTDVIYTAMDFERNKVFCIFTVYVRYSETTSSDTDEATESKSAVSVIAGTLTASLAIVVIVIILIILFRHNRLKQRRETNSQQRGTSSQQQQQLRSRSRPRENCYRMTIPITAISNLVYDSNISRGSVIPSHTATMVPPPYSPAINPPTYEEVLQHNQSMHNEDKPPEYEYVVSQNNGNASE